MAGSGKSSANVHIRSRVPIAAAARLRDRLEPVLEPEDIAEIATVSETSVELPATGDDPEPAVRLKAALLRHLETVEAAFAPRRDDAPANQATVEPAPEPPARSKYAPDPEQMRSSLDLRPPRTRQPEPPPAPVAPKRSAFAPPAVRAANDVRPVAAEPRTRWDSPADVPPEPRPTRDPRLANYRQSLPDRAMGFGARALVITLLAGVAAGVGGIAAYQWTGTEHAAPPAATAAIAPTTEVAKSPKVDTDRVPQIAGADAGGADPQAPAVSKAVPPRIVRTDPAPTGSVAAKTREAMPVALRPTHNIGAASADALVAASPVKVAVPPDDTRLPLAFAPPAEADDPVASAMELNGASGAPPKRLPQRVASAGDARVTMDVNLRASADNGARMIKVLPKGSVVQVVECTFWCEVVSGGQHGFVYRRFIGK
jgi:hypothetical protein